MENRKGLIRIQLSRELTNSSFLSKFFHQLPTNTELARVLLSEDSDTLLFYLKHESFPYLYEVQVGTAAIDPVDSNMFNIQHKVDGVKVLDISINLNEGDK